MNLSHFNLLRLAPFRLILPFCLLVNSEPDTFFNALVDLYCYCPFILPLAVFIEQSFDPALIEETDFVAHTAIFWVNSLRCLSLVSLLDCLGRN